MSGWYRPQRVDEEGVPCLIQHLRYNYGSMMFVAVFFDGSADRYTSDKVCPSISLTQHRITHMQELEAINNIEQMELARRRRHRLKVVK